MFQKVCPQCRRISSETSARCPGCGCDLTSVAELRATPRRSLSAFLPGAEGSAVLLVIGQAAAVLACIAQIVAVVAGIAQGQLLVVGAGILGLCLSAGMFIVFNRIRLLPWIIAAQDAENEALWQAIAVVRLPSAEQGAADRPRDHDSTAITAPPP